MRCDCDDRASVRATPIRPTSASALADPPDLGVSPDRRRRPGGSRVGPGPQPTDDILACVRDVAQSGSAPALGAGGRRFKSARPDQAIRRAGVAQLARASAFQAEGRGFEARLPLQHHLERQALPGADSVPRCRGVRQVVTRARSSAGQSRGLLILRSQVRILPGAPLICRYFALCRIPRCPVSWPFCYGFATRRGRQRLRPAPRPPTPPARPGRGACAGRPAS